MEFQIFFFFLFMFLFVYLFAYFVVLCKWGPKHRLEASSCFISLAHGSPVVIMAIAAILQAPNMADFAAQNTKFQGLVLQYSIAYFLVDLLHCMLFYPRDFLFICHHLAVLYVFLSCHYLVRHGAVPILVLLVVAELSSGCQNVWALAGYRRGDVKAAAKFQDFLAPYFYTFYSILRGGLAPVILHKMGVFYVSGLAENLIPKWAWISWMGVIATAIFVSILWIGNHWVVWYQYRKHGKAV